MNFYRIFSSLMVGFFLSTLSGLSLKIHAQALKVGTFQVDVSPPIGSPVAYAPARSIVDPISARGIVLLPEGQLPIVLCAVDFIGIANEGMDRWRQALAQAGKTDIHRVWVSTLHQHDGPACDYTADKIMGKYGLGGTRFDTVYLNGTIRKVAKAVSKAVKNNEAVDQIGFGEATVDSVASNRRILGPEDTVVIIRWSKTRDPEAIAAPEGLIDPWLKCLSFWNGSQPVAVLTYYATHPQSYYGQGDVTCEFVGIARNNREKLMHGLPHIHFNGAGGNITAGKYNDGSPENRPVLARRLQEGMRKAWENTEKIPLDSKIQWNYTPVSLPLGNHLDAPILHAQLENPNVPRLAKFTAASHLAWLQRTASGYQVEISSLQIGDYWILNLPGEIFIEYQLAAQKLKAPGKVCVAAYGEYGPGYIGTRQSYYQGGYETSKRASKVSEDSEMVIMEAIKKLLGE